ncbi:MAG TPA: RHS repeat-associated core domain-containing protein, partial [Ignavibacteria bacterium]
SAQDYDAWGFELNNRTYNDVNKYKFTSKERDVESSYDYFGARYYDSRIGRWGQMEPKLDKYLSYNPYNYSFLNPLKMIDIDGKDIRAVTTEAQQMILNTIPIEIQSYIIFNESGIR